MNLQCEKLLDFCEVKTLLKILNLWYFEFSLSSNYAVQKPKGDDTTVERYKV